VHTHGLHDTGSHADTRARNGLFATPGSKARRGPHGSSQSSRRTTWCSSQRTTCSSSRRTTWCGCPPGAAASSACSRARGGGGAHVRVVRDQVLEGDAGVVRGAGVRQHAHPEATAASHTQLVGVLPEWGRSVSPSLRAGPQNLGAHTQLTTGDTLPLGKTALSKYLVMLEGFQELVRWSRWSTGACRTG